MFSFIIETPEGITNLPITIFALLSNFWISGFRRFFAPPRGFSLSPPPADFYPCPAPQKNAPPRTTLVWIRMLLDKYIIDLGMGLLLWGSFQYQKKFETPGPFEVRVKFLVRAESDHQVAG